MTKLTEKQLNIQAIQRMASNWASTDHNHGTYVKDHIKYFLTHTRLDTLTNAQLIHLGKALGLLISCAYGTGRNDEKTMFESDNQ